MELGDAQSRRLAQDEARRRGRTRRARLGALVSLVAVIAVLLAIVTGSGGSGSSHHAASTGKSTASSTTASAAPKPSTTAVPILTYYVINSAPPGSTAPADLYVPLDQFTSQMQALKAQGWHAVTLDQLEAYWTHGKPLGPGKPIVITFDNGYASQYTNALPVLKGLGWVAVANLEVNGLSPTDGGLSDTQIRALIAAGWEIDAEGASHTDLTSVGRDRAAGADGGRSAGVERPLQRARELVLLSARAVRLECRRGRSLGGIRRRNDNRSGVGRGPGGSLPPAAPAGRRQHERDQAAVADRRRRA